MHELAVTKSILQIVLDQTSQQNGRKVLSISLVIGEMRNLEEEWIQRYFDQISHKTKAEGAIIHVKKKPVAFLCSKCVSDFTANIHLDQKILCPHCSSDEYELISGRELLIETMEIV